MQPDKITWRWTADGSYSAASAYLIQFTGSVSSNLKAIIWKTPVPAKLKLSASLCVQERCLTAYKLARRGWPHNPVCSLCSSHSETALHIFMQYPYSPEVWRLAFYSFGIPVDLVPTAATPLFRHWWEIGHDRFASKELKTSGRP